jgi:indolepyruvate ferredoxin oxidoreductase alpha subunit
MGASLGVGVGLRHVLPREEAKRVVSVIGDSTFVHSGLTGLAEMSYNVPPTGHVLLILDNATTAMTGQQEHPGTGRLLDHTPANQLDYETVVRAMNVPNVGTFDPVRQPAEFEVALVEALEKDELTVLIVRRPCILAVARKDVKPAAQG